MTKRLIAIICALVTVLTFCSCTSPEKYDLSPSFEAGDIEPINHRLKTIILMDSESYITTMLPETKPVSEDNQNLFFKVDRSLTGFVLRNWSANDISPYKENGVISFDAKGEGTVRLTIGVGEIKNGEYTQVLKSHYLELTDEWASYELPLSSIDNDFCNVRDILVGEANGEMYISNIRLSSPDSEKIYPAIKVNQVGYTPDGDKTAVVSGFYNEIGFDGATEFEVVSVDGERVYTGSLKLISGGDFDYSGEVIYQADFTELTKEGEYFLRLKGIGEKSTKFRIGENVYDDLLRDIQRYYYYQRANCEIVGDYPRGDMSPEDFCLPLRWDMESSIDVSGGWYDAGDIGKYVSPGATAINTLLWAYKLHPEKFYDGQNDIPESGNGIPDLLDEIRYELDFILKMQDKSSGGFYMKAKSLTADDKQKDRVVWEATANSTADSIAALAFASVIYREFDESYADRLLESALLGWEFIEKNPKLYLPYDTAYAGEENDNATFWAAGSLFYATEDDRFGDYVKAHYKEYTNCFDSSADCHSVGTMAVYGFYGYLMSDKADRAIRSEVKELFEARKQTVIDLIRQNPWSIPVDKYSLWWGSFNVVLGNAQDFTIGCYVLEGDISAARDICQRASDFILGENPLRKCFVTGNGDDPIKCTFSTFYTDLTNGFPEGYMPGGINSHDGELLSRFPLKCYANVGHDWVTNENSVYWNGVLIFNISML